MQKMLEKIGKSDRAGTVLRQSTVCSNVHSTVPTETEPRRTRQGVHEEHQRNVRRASPIPTWRGSTQVADLGAAAPSAAVSPEAKTRRSNVGSPPGSPSPAQQMSALGQLRRCSSKSLQRSRESMQRSNTSPDCMPGLEPEHGHSCSSKVSRSLPHPTPVYPSPRSPVPPPPPRPRRLPTVNSASPSRLPSPRRPGQCRGGPRGALCGQ